MKEDRPWGHYNVLYDGNDCKVKRISVKPGHKISYQYHSKRKEQWIVVSGKGFTKLNEVTTIIEPGSIIEIPIEARHTIGSQGIEPLVFIEVQTGDYFGEDDIVRLEDDYGRA